MKQILYITLKH